MEMEYLNCESTNQIKQEMEDKCQIEDHEAEVDALTNLLVDAFKAGIEIPEKIGTCEKCRKDIIEKSMLIGDKTFHDDCFTCDYCSVKLNERYYQLNDKYYCEQDKDKDIPSCSLCETLITGDYVIINDNKIHASCFVCGVCGEKIEGKFYQESGKFLCLADFEEMADKCEKCSLPIIERFLTFNDQKYHAECFRCNICSKSLDGEKYFGESNEAVCEDCFEATFAIKCHRCKKSLNTGSATTTTRIIQCDNKSYHIDCYSCMKCNTSLENQNVYLDATGEVICLNCINNWCQ